MPRFSRPVLIVGVLLTCWPLAEALAQEAAAPTKATHVLGFQDAKRSAKGTLDARGGNFEFAVGKKKTDLPITAIQDVSIGSDSRRVFGGPVETVAMFAPYGGGRFLSLFREKTDVLTVTYRDANGGLHGAIFSLAEGKAKDMKKELIALGAHTTPVQEPPKPAEQQEKKP